MMVKLWFKVRQRQVSSPLGISLGSGTYIRAKSILLLLSRFSGLADFLGSYPVRLATLKMGIGGLLMSIVASLWYR